MYVRKFDDQVLTFRVSGKLWMRSLVMSDVETDTEWSHLLGRAMAGKLKGAKLEPIVSDMSTWASWLEKHPRTTVLDMSPTTKNYTREFYRNPAAFVFGFEAGGKTWALPFEALLTKHVQSFDIKNQSLLAAFDRNGAVVRLFSRNVDGETLDFVAIDEITIMDKQTRSRWRIDSGEATEGPLKGTRMQQKVGIMSFRTAWQDFHPDSDDIAGQ